MTETVDTSSHSVVRPHRVSEQSVVYQNELPEDNEEVLRFDLPWDMVNIVGIRWADRLRVILDNDRLLMSVLPLPRPNLYEYDAPLYLSKRNGFVKSSELVIESDNVYTLLPKEFIPNWNAYDTVEYSYIHETEKDDRHIEAKHTNNSS